MIYYYRDEIILHEAYQMISLLMDIDGLMIKWRCKFYFYLHKNDMLSCDAVYQSLETFISYS